MKKPSDIKFLDLTLDSAFKSFFTRYEKNLVNFLNMVLPHGGADPIANLRLGNSELHGHPQEKGSFLDIFATTTRGESINVEIQRVGHPFFLERILLYWANIYRKDLKKGDPYTKLCPTYNITFTLFNPFERVEKGPRHFRYFFLQEGLLEEFEGSALPKSKQWKGGRTVLSHNQLYVFIESKRRLSSFETLRLPLTHCLTPKIVGAIF